jgi:Xaa-Pro aminopeptidase
MGFELDVLPVNDFKFYRDLFETPAYVDGSPHILKVRMIKSEWEIQQLENTAELTRKTFEYMRTAIRPGLTEMEFAGMFETYARKLGHGAHLRVRHFQTEGYPWHVLSGKSGGMVGLLDSPASGEGTSAAFPVGAGNKKLHSGEPIMVDLGSVLNGYHMDETRMFAIDSMPERAMKLSTAAIEIHNSVSEKAKPGITVGELFDHSVKLATSLGFEDSYLGPPGHKVVFIGHGIGLELIEPHIIAKKKKDRLEPGMTFALEPKLVCENEFAAGIESVFRVTDSGSRLISKIPVDIFIC